MKSKYSENNEVLELEFDEFSVADRLCYELDLLIRVQSELDSDEFELAQICP